MALRLNLTISILLILSLSNMFAQEKGQWVECVGEAAIQHISYEEARTIALRKARLNAIEQVCGVNLQAETMVKDFRLAGDFIHSISYGHIVEEKNIKWKTETVSASEPDAPPIIFVKVSLRAKVVPQNEQPDPSFKVDLTLNRTIFLAGEEVVFKIKASQDCYVTILNIAANDSVYILFPNKFQNDNFIRKNEAIEIPDKESRELGLHIRVAPLPGHKKDTEVVKVIATKQRIDFIEQLDLSGAFAPIGTPRLAITKLARWLSQIPISGRAEAAALYTVETAK